MSDASRDDHRADGAAGEGRGTATKIVHAGRDPRRFDGFVNTPVVRGSTVLYPNYDDLIHHRARYTYGRHGNPTSESLRWRSPRWKAVTAWCSPRPACRR